MGEAGPHRQWLRLNTVSETSRHSAFNFAILILDAMSAESTAVPVVTWGAGCLPNLSYR